MHGVELVGLGGGRQQSPGQRARLRRGQHIIDVHADAALNPAVSVLQPDDDHGVVVAGAVKCRARWSSSSRSVQSFQVDGVGGRGRSGVVGIRWAAVLGMSNPPPTSTEVT